MARLTAFVYGQEVVLTLGRIGARNTYVCYELILMSFSNTLTCIEIELNVKKYGHVPLRALAKTYFDEVQSNLFLGRGKQERDVPA